MTNTYKSSTDGTKKASRSLETTNKQHKDDVFPPRFSRRQSGSISPTDITHDHGQHERARSCPPVDSRSNSSTSETPTLNGKCSSWGQNSIYIYLASILSAISGFLLGYDTGITSGALIYMRDDFKLDNEGQELVVSATSFGAWLFAILTGPIADKFGRKLVIVVSSTVFIAGSVLLAFAQSFFALFFGRLVLGAAIGLSSMTVPMYIAEVAPPDIRGKLVVMLQMLITGGQFSATIIAYGFSFIEGNHAWRYMLGFGALPAVIQFLAFLFMPESPRWLIKEEQYDRAKEVLAKFRPPGSCIESEFEAIRDSCVQTKKKQTNSNLATLKRILTTQPVRRALIVGSLLQLLQQLTGINTVMYYTASIIEMAGVRTKQMALLLSIGTAFTNFAFTLVGFYLVERSGRRRLTLCSLFGAIVCLLILAGGFQFANYNAPKVNTFYAASLNYPCDTIEDCFACSQRPECGYCFADGPTFGSVSKSFCLRATSDGLGSEIGNCTTGTSQYYTWASNWCPSAYSWVIVVGMVLYLMCFAPGMGPMPWTVNSEIYPLWARSLCLSCTTSVNWISNLMVSLTFLSLINAITSHGAFYLYAVLSFIGFICLVFVLPETRGKTLEELKDLFASKEWLEDERNRKKVEDDEVEYLNEPPTFFGLH